MEINTSGLLQRNRKFIGTENPTALLVIVSEALEPDWLIAAGAYPGFCSMKRLGVFLLPLDGIVIVRLVKLVYISTADETKVMHVLDDPVEPSLRNT